MKYLLFLLLPMFGLYFTRVTANQLAINENGCECIDYDCGCCNQLKVMKIIDGKLCANFSYLPDEYGISVTITYNDNAILNRTLSVKNPPPICLIHVDQLKMEICLHFYNLDIKNKCFSGCAEFEISFFRILPLEKLKLGCFGCSNTTLSRLTQKLNIVDYFQGKTKYYNNEPNVVLI